MLARLQPLYFHSAGDPDFAAQLAVLRVPDGHRLMHELASHHDILAHGRNRAGVEMLGVVFGLAVNRIG